MIRSVFRVVEYVQGNDGSLLGSEVYLYVFDAVLMFAVVAGFNIIHPGQIGSLLRKLGGSRSDSEGLDDGELMERM